MDAVCLPGKKIETERLGPRPKWGKKNLVSEKTACNRTIDGLHQHFKIFSLFGRKKLIQLHFYYFLSPTYLCSVRLETLHKIAMLSPDILAY